MEARNYWRSKRISGAERLTGIETRSVSPRSKLTLDADDDRVVLFYTPYGHLSEPLKFGEGKYFREEIAPFAFSESIRGGDVFCLYDHNIKRILGHQSLNFTIKEDKDGLRCRVKLDWGEFNDSVLDAVGAGTLQASVRFLALKETWPSGTKRIIEKGDLVEISLVHSPAYKTTLSCMTPPPGKEN